ncbi:MAG TPA: nitrilase-related carbon-nitrogen hydrolase [Thermoanaerobaculales bacterium]|nr:nitrilase-related carbon-nitrogen hydrolase [Thermoanaerobaculales bacterium]
MLGSTREATVRVAGIQLDVAWEDPAANLPRASSMVAEAAAAGARLIVLPEMFATGFSMAATEMAAHADAIRGGLSELARRHGVWLLGGYAEPGEERPHNACSLMNPEGSEVLHYRKIHPFSMAGEGDHYEAGTRMVTADVEGIRITPTICYDLRFPEIYRATAAHTDLFVVIASWPDRRSDAWRTLLAARAIDCLAWVLGVNRVGKDPYDVPHRGDTSLVDPMGKAVEALAWAEGIVAGEVDVVRARELRRRLPFLDDRRPEVYASLAPTRPGDGG